MNSEELELSLRTEFESYLKGFLAELRQEVSEFQKSFETEFEKHKAHTDEAVSKLVQRFDAGVAFDQAFNESVIEHLRLARDEGATITAVAIGEAEKLKEQTAPAAEFDKLRDAINEISNKASQSEILKSLVDHAAHFAPRGTFFIVKNEQFVGWRAFGDEAKTDESAVREVQFPMSADTLLAKAIENLKTVAGNAGGHADNEQFLDPLDFGRPDRMYAIPLVARGRGVAVLYADYGTEGVALNPEALETLVRVAGLTVELAAAAVQPAPVQQPETAPAVEEPRTEETAAAETVEEPVEAEKGFDAVAEPEAVEESSFETFAAPVVEETVEAPAETVEEEAVPVEHFGEIVPEQAKETAYVEEADQVETIETAEVVAEPAFTEPEQVEEYVPVEAVEEFPEIIDEPVVEPVSEYVPQRAETFNVSPAPTFEPAVEAPRAKYRDRNVDLPIEVPEDERRLHNDARRFARLLVSEIKLYNEQKVADGRQAGDLYDRLREAIDRSREMYDKRVQQAVADKFDYFHFELVSSLAEGEDVKLGAAYPGSKVPA